MTIVSYNRGRLVYVTHENHDACIVMSTFKGEPIADIFIDDFFAEVPECSISTKDGHPLKIAMNLAMSELRIRNRIDHGVEIDRDCGYRLCGLDWGFVDEFLNDM